MCASALDPRHKHLRFLDPALRLSTEEKLSELHDGVPLQGPDDTEGESSDAPAHSITSASEALETHFGEDYIENSEVNKLEAYFSEPCIRPQQNPMEWWKSNRDRYEKTERSGKAAPAYPRHLRASGASVLRRGTESEQNALSPVSRARRYAGFSHQELIWIFG